MGIPTQITEFWLACQMSLPEADLHRHPGCPPAWGFGDSREMADRLVQLVLRGTKTATASLLWELADEGEPLPAAGDLSIILDGSGEPLCLIETTQVRVVPFIEVDAGFAYDEGEGDRSLSYWREAHWDVFSRTCSSIGRQPMEDMLVVCERFRRIFPRADLPGKQGSCAGPAC